MSNSIGIKATPTKHVIEIQAKEWYDKQNGNSYFSVRVFLDGEYSKPLAIIRLQYGYGSQYEHVGLQIIREKFTELEGLAVWQIREKGFMVISNLQNGCTRKLAEAWGEV